MINDVSVRIYPEKSGAFPYAVRSPYNKQCLIEFKQLMPESARTFDWECKAWHFRKKYLPAVRELMQRYAEQESWVFIDETTMQEQERDQAVHEAEQRAREEHIENFCNAVAELPPRSLRIDKWDAKHITLNFTQYLEDYRLYKKVRRAGWGDNQFDDTFLVLNDERIVDALVTIPLLSITPLVTNVVYHAVENEQVFNGGVIHWIDKTGQSWHAAPYTMWLEQELLRIYPSRECHVCMYEGVCFAGEAEVIFKYMVTSCHAHYNDPSAYIAYVNKFHLFEPFKTWATPLIEQPEVKAYKEDYPHSYLCQTRYYQHPADDLLDFLLHHFELLPELFTKEYLYKHYNRVQTTKQHLAQNHMDYCHEHAKELARIELAKKSYKRDLVKIAQEHHITLKESWSMAKMIDEMLDSEAGEKLAVELLELPDHV